VKLLNPFLDKLQALFPPNRVAILLAAPITAAAAWLSGLVTANIPGVELPPGVIAGVMFVCVLIVVRLLDKWFDQWQAGEPLDVGKDLEAAFEEIVDGHQQIDHLLGTTAGVGTAIEGLHDRLVKGQINEAEVADELAAIAGTTAATLRRHIPADQAEPPEVPVASPGPDAAPPTAPTAE
jgi:hypothetical protein